VHAAVALARTLPRDATVVINVSGRGDKDVNEVIRLRGG
jgi:tryptophan synthase beta subunit